MRSFILLFSFVSLSLFSQEIKISKGNSRGSISIIEINDSSVYLASFIKYNTTSIQRYDKSLNLLSERTLEGSMESQFSFIHKKFIVLYCEYRKIGFLQFTCFVHAAKPFENVDVVVDSFPGRVLMYNNGSLNLSVSDNEEIMIRKDISFPKSYKEFFYVKNWKDISRSTVEDTATKWHHTSILAGGVNPVLGQTYEERQYGAYSPSFSEITNPFDTWKKYYERETCFDNGRCFKLIENYSYKVITENNQNGTNGGTSIKEKFGNIFIIDKMQSSLKDPIRIRKIQRVSYSDAGNRPTSFSYVSYLFFHNNNKGYIFWNKGLNIQCCVFDANGIVSKKVLMKNAQIVMDIGLQVSDSKVMVPILVGGVGKKLGLITLE